MLYEHLYRIMEVLDGERLKGFKVMPYRFAQKIKLKLLAGIATVSRRPVAMELRGD